VEIHETGKVVLVRLRGKVGLSEAGALEASLLRLGALRPSCVTFDLEGLAFISSLAMGVLAAYRRAAVRAGARVFLAPELHPAVREALDRTGLTGLFETADEAGPCAGPTSCAEGARQPDPSASDVRHTCPVTWAQLVELEPQLETLLRRARTAGAGCRSLPDVHRIFTPLRNELADLIGFIGKHHSHPILGGCGAYEVAYWKLYEAVAGLLPRPAGAAAEALQKQ
jgi:anti-anti-sigma factor